MVQSIPDSRHQYLRALQDLKFEFNGKGDDYGCIAHTTYTEDGQSVSGTEVTIKMAKSQGWWGKKGSLWPDMPEQMLCYRAAAFFARLYCPEITMGMHTVEEMIDIGDSLPKDVNITADTDITILGGEVETDAKPHTQVEADGDPEPGPQSKVDEQTSGTAAQEEKPKPKRRSRRSPQSKPKEEQAPKVNGPTPDIEDDDMPF